MTEVKKITIPYNVEKARHWNSDELYRVETWLNANTEYAVEAYGEISFFGPEAKEHIVLFRLMSGL